MPSISRPVAADSASDTPASPGVLLRNQRLEKGWSETTVADALCLSHAQLEALENDEYASLPGSTYIIGYWKSYAKLLDISIKDSIAIYREKLVQTDPYIATSSNLKRSPRQSIWLLMSLPVIFLVVIWFFQKPSTEVFSEDNKSDVDSQALTIQPEAVPKLQIEQPQNQASQLLLSQSLAILPEPNFATDKRITIDSEIMASYVQDKWVLAEPVEEPRKIAVERSSEQDASPVQQKFSPNRVEFVVDEQSWLGVQDATGKRLIYRLVNRAQRLTVEGQPPFSVFIGNASGVSVKYLGQIVPFQASQEAANSTAKNQVFARFKIGTTH